MQLAQIDPVALNLLARMGWKYRTTLTYDTLVRIKRSDQLSGNRLITRFRTDMGQFVWSQWAPDNRWRKWVFDGKTVVIYNSAYPGQYRRREFKDFSGRDFNRVLDYLGLDYSTLPLVMSGDWPGKMLAHPDLKTVSMKAEKDLSVVTLSFQSERSFEGQPDTIRFFIEPKTLMLRRISKRETMIDGEKTSELTTDEIYSQSNFEPKLSFDLFRVAAPSNYKMVENFHEFSAKP